VFLCRPSVAGSGFPIYIAVALRLCLKYAT
jgi:hypothetical protein